MTTTDTQVKPTDSVLMNYFKGLNAFVPNYQRSYEWGVDQIDEFMEDLFAETERDENSKYFFGPVVTTTDDEGHKQIIDGQQRLTTSVMFFSMIRNLVARYGKDDPNAQNIRSVIDTELIGGMDEYHELTIVQTGEIAADFKRVIQNFNSKQEDQPLEVYKGRGAKGKGKINQVHRAYNELLTKTQEFFHNNDVRTDQERILALKQLFNTFVKHFFVVEIWAPNRTDAFQIFQTINARGLDLSAADLIKSDFFGNSGKDQPKVEALWVQVQTILGDLDMSDFIRYVWNFKYTFTQKRNLYKSLSQHVHGKESIVDFMTDLNKLAKPYAEMNDDPEAIFLNADREGVQALQIIHELNILGFRIYAPVYLAMVSEDYAHAEILTVLEAVRSILARTKLLGNSTNTLERLFAKVGNTISTSEKDHAATIEDVAGTLKDEQPKSSSVKAALEDYDFSDLRAARFVLRTIENAQQTEKQFSDNQDVHVEHIMPKNPKPKDLESWGVTEESHRDNLWKLGNLTLWYGPTNSAAGNVNFKEKQKYYQDSDVGLTRELMNYDHWSVDTIVERTDQLIQRFLTVIGD